MTKTYISKLVKKVIRKIKNSEVTVRKSRISSINNKYCPVCDSYTHMTTFPYEYYFNKFYENGFIYSPFLFETLNLKHYSCSNCGANDRERLIALFLNDYLKNKIEKLSLIDFGPAKPLQKFIKKKHFIKYKSADLYMDDVDDKIDIRDMIIYGDNCFDLFICSHILEHIEEDDKAMKELFRITNKNGIGICLVPIMLGIEKTVENKEYLDSEHLRWKYFGQEDHVRMYSKNNFIEKLENAGFRVKQFGKEKFGKELFEKCAIDHKSVLYIVTK